MIEVKGVVAVPFHGGEVLVVEVEGKPHVVLRPALERLGIDYSGQLQRLRRKSWATVGISPTQDQYRDMVTVDVRTFLMLLATIDERRVNEAAKPLLVAYQREVADVVERYWTDGGAINPRATDDQLATLIGRAEGQMRVLRLADGLVDRRWLEAKARHTVARALGEEPEVEYMERPLDVGSYLEGQGVPDALQRSVRSTFGKAVKALYKQRHNADPPKVPRFIEGALRQVAGYTEADRDLFDEAWAQMTARASKS